MNNIGIQALLLPLASTHLMLTHHDLMAMIEIVRALGNSYRLAASEPGSSFLHGRLAFNFCRGVVMWLAVGGWASGAERDAQRRSQPLCQRRDQEERRHNFQASRRVEIPNARTTGSSRRASLRRASIVMNLSP
ncbi:hypothetical protein [Bradyrhizobium sp. 149]|uniref:hypothetical protein n=1 Tax=Bradyrhizobium sp. 149 TaxID=2782624 RepID=UPI001FF97BAA|nr:hypothetical protein [Bradyrhizobium sp. 149]